MGPEKPESTTDKAGIEFDRENTFGTVEDVTRWLKKRIQESTGGGPSRKNSAAGIERAEGCETGTMVL